MIRCRGPVDSAPVRCCQAYCLASLVPIASRTNRAVSNGKLEGQSLFWNLGVIRAAPLVQKVPIPDAHGLFADAFVHFRRATAFELAGSSRIRKPIDLA
jgi:hypothetical protein